MRRAVKQCKIFQSASQERAHRHDRRRQIPKALQVADSPRLTFKFSFILLIPRLHSIPILFQSLGQRQLIVGLGACRSVYVNMRVVCTSAAGEWHQIILVKSW